VLTDPQSVKFGAEAIVSLPRIGSGQTSADYQSADGAVSLRVTQNENKTTRRTSAAYRKTKIAADALTSVNQRVAATVSINVTAPLAGFTPAELADMIAGAATALTASSNAMALKILGGEK